MHLLGLGLKTYHEPAVRSVPYVKGIVETRDVWRSERGEIFYKKKYLMRRKQEAIMAKPEESLGGWPSQNNLIVALFYIVIPFNRSESKSPVRSNRGNGSFDGVVAHPDESKVDNPERSFLPTSPAKIQSGTAVNTENSVDENKIDPDQCKGILQKMWDAKTADGSVVQWSEEGPQLMVDIAYEVIQDEREEMYFKEVLIPRFLNDSNELLEPILGTLTNAAAALSWFRELASKVNPSFQNGTPTSTPSKL